MANISKRVKSYRQQVDVLKVYPVLDAIELVKKCATAKFNESIDVAVILGIDVKRSDQVVRGASVLPNGTGKTVRVAVFAQGADVETAKAAGADLVGSDDLVEKIKQGIIEFDVLIATPNMMGAVGKVGAILGPRGLMPNPKLGTVTANVALAVKNAKGGQVTYRTDKNGIIHCNIGKASFTAEQLQENLQRLMEDLKKARPSAAKGIYFKKLKLSSTMGPGVTVDLSTLAV